VSYTIISASLLVRVLFGPENMDWDEFAMLILGARHCFVCHVTTHQGARFCDCLPGDLITPCSRDFCGEFYQHNHPKAERLVPESPQPKICKHCLHFRPVYKDRYSPLLRWNCGRSPSGFYQLPDERELDLVFDGTCGPDGKYWEQRQEGQP